MIVVLHHFNKFLWAKIYFSISIPIWYSIAMLLVGGNFGQSLMSASTVMITYFLLKDKVRLRNNLIIFNIILYLSAITIALFIDPLLGERDYPFDEVIVWGLALGWLSILFSIHEERTNLFIQSLKDKNKQLQQKTNELERFTFIASHDLKSPIRNIISFLNLIRRDIDTEQYDKISEYLSYAETGAYQMHELIEGVLEISRIDQVTPSSFELVDLNTVLQQVMVNLRIELLNTKIKATNLPEIHCQKSDFLILFQNLIQNAVKYNTSDLPIINISSKVEKDYHFLEFTDNGIGIEEQYYDQVFDFFKRLHSSKQYPGSGLGLGLCKKIIEKYNGSISVHSEVNKYSTFSIQIPISSKKQAFSESKASVVSNLETTAPTS